MNEFLLTRNYPNQEVQVSTFRLTDLDVQIDPAAAAMTQVQGILTVPIDYPRKLYGAYCYYFGRAVGDEYYQAAFELYEGKTAVNGQPGSGRLFVRVYGDFAQPRFETSLEIK